MSGQMITMNKKPGIIPSGFGEKRRRIMAECLIQVTEQEAKAACGKKQLAGDVEARVEGGINAMRVL